MRLHTEVIEVGRHSEETIGAEVTTTADPTAIAPRWSFIPTSETDPNLGAANGSWETWNSYTKKVIAVSPSFPVSGSEYALSPGEYDIHVNWQPGSESPWKRIGRLRIY